MSLSRYTLWAKLLEKLRLARTPKGKHLKVLARIVCVVAACFLLNAVSFHYFERASGRALSWFDALWFSATTITTVGYGDLYPETVAARIGTFLLMYMVGIALLPVAIAHFLAYFDVARELEVAGMCENKQKDCLVVVHFPNPHWTKTLIDEVRAEPELATIPIWIIDPILDRLPESIASLPDVHFIHGNTIDIDTYKRANVEHARFVVVLPREPTLSDTDAATSTVVRVVRGLTSARIIPLQVDSKNIHLFEGFRGLVQGDFAMKVAAQELSDPYVARGVDNLMSNREGCLPLSLEINQLANRTVGALETMIKAFTESPETQGELRLLAHVHRGMPNWLPKPDDLLEEGDAVILAGDRRPSEWAKFEERLLGFVDEA